MINQQIAIHFHVMIDLHLQYALVNMVSGQTEMAIEFLATCWFRHVWVFTDAYKELCPYNV